MKDHESWAPIDVQQIVDATFELANKTSRKKHIHISLEARFFAHCPEEVDVCWAGYVEDVGRSGGLGGDRRMSLTEVKHALLDLCRSENYLRAAAELEADADRLRRLARKAGGE